jgi:hypothetical protein
MHIDPEGPFAKIKIGEKRRSECIVGNPSLTGLWKGCPSSARNRQVPNGASHKSGFSFFSSSPFPEIARNTSTLDSNTALV